MCTEDDKDFEEAVDKQDDVGMMQAILSYMGTLLAFSEVYDLVFGHDGRKTLLALLKQSKGFSDFSHIVEIYSSFYSCHYSENIFKSLSGIRDGDGFTAFREDCYVSFGVVAEKIHLHKLRGE